MLCTCRFSAGAAALLARAVAWRQPLRVDAHHHLWHYTPEEYGWIDASMPVLRRSFLGHELAEVCAAAGVTAAVAVQARQTLEETEWLLGLAVESELIRGVVGWADLAAKDFAQTLSQVAGDPALKGLRHVVQAEPPGFLDGEAFNRGIAALGETGLVYDVLIHAGQLEEATRLVDRHPQQRFVLDHMAKPRIAQGEMEPWATQIRELARRPQVVCKVSGMVTEADWGAWTPEGLRPYFDTVLAAFGPERLMAGSDWPVLTLASSYERWWQVLAQWMEPLTEYERALIEGGTAVRVYGLTTQEESR